jgi:lipopolysaccharide export system permease protein
MNRIDRYFFRYLLAPVGVFLLGLLVLYSAFTMSVAMAAVLVGELPSEQFWFYVLARNTIALEVLLPTACFLGMVLAVSQFHRDREAFALYASGVSPARLSRVVWLISLLLAVLVAALAIYGRPWSYRINDDILRQASLERAAPGEFYEISDDLVVYARRAGPDGALNDVFAWRSSDSGREVVRANSARMRRDENGQLWLKLDQGEQYSLSAENRVVTFAELWRRLEVPADTRGLRRKARATALLLGATSNKDIAELQWRLALPLIAFFLPLIALRLGYQAPGRSGYGRIWIALAVYLLIFLLTSALRTAVENDQLAPNPGLFLMPPLLLAFYLAIQRWPRR